MKNQSQLKALIGAYRLIEYAKRHGAFTLMGGDRYIYESDIHKGLCDALGLEYKTATRSELETALLNYSVETRGPQ